MLDATPLATSTIESGGSPVVVFGVWIPRKGDNVRSVVDVVFNLHTNFTVAIFHKNYEDAGDGASASVSASYSDSETGRKTMELLGAKELVRFRLTLERGESLEDVDVGIVFFRFLEPAWFEAVKV
jgi:hypothetical protein